MTAAEALDTADRIRAEATALYQACLTDSQWEPAYQSYRKLDEAVNALERLAANLALRELKASR